jgi:AraC family transcriptional regulator
VRGTFAPIAQCKDVRVTSTGGFSLADCRVPPHTVLPWHAHEHACIVLALAGSFTEQFGTRRVCCEVPVALFKPAGERHANVYGHAGARFLIIELQTPQVEQCRERGVSLDRIRAVRSAAVADLGGRLRRELQDRDAYSGLSIAGLTYEILAVVARGADWDRRDGGAAPPWLRRVYDEVTDTFMQPLSITDLAAQSGVHPDHLSRSFRRYYGLLIGEYARSLRLDWAARRLVEVDLPLSDIATTAGFADQSEFTRRFSKQFGTTPGRYRRGAARVVHQRTTGQTMGATRQGEAMHASSVDPTPPPRRNARP